MRKLQRVSFILLLACLLGALVQAGCGYQLTSREPSVLTRLSNSTVVPGDDGTLPTMKIKGINNPTLYISLEHQLRSAFRDAIANRNIARWQDFGLADYELQINIVKYTLEGWGYSRSGDSVMYNASMSMNAVVYSGETNQPVWSSGTVSLARTYDTDNEADAARALALEIVDRLVDRMRSVF